MKKLKVGIIGLGFGVTSHLPAFKSNKYCEVIALCSKNLEKGEIFRKKNNIKHYFPNWRRMLNEIELDLVSIAVPPNEQFNIICECLKKSIPVFAEKPLATNIIDSKKIFFLQKKFNVPCAIDFIFPEIPEWIFAKKIINSKRFGKIRNINIDLNYQSYSNLIKENSWKNNISKGGGVLHHIICHVFYYVEWFLEPVASLSACLYSGKNYKYSGYTNAVILLKFSSNVYAVINASNDSCGINEHTIKFFNDLGAIVLENKKVDWVNGFDLFTIKRNNLIKKKIIIKKNKIKNNLDPRFYIVSKIVEKLVNWIIFKKKTSPNFEDGHRVQHLIDAAIQSNKLNGKWINLK